MPPGYADPSAAGVCGLAPCKARVVLDVPAVALREELVCVPDAGRGRLPGLEDVLDAVLAEDQQVGLAVGGVRDLPACSPDLAPPSGGCGWRGGKGDCGRECECGDDEGDAALEAFHVEVLPPY